MRVPIIEYLGAGISLICVVTAVFYYRVFDSATEASYYLLWALIFMALSINYKVAKIMEEKEDG